MLVRERGLNVSEETPERHCLKAWFEDDRYSWMNGEHSLNVQIARLECFFVGLCHVFEPDEGRLMIQIYLYARQ